MTFLSQLMVGAIRAARRYWPGETGRNWPAYVGAVGARFGLCQPVWREFQPGLRMRLDIRDMIQQTILLEDKWDPPLTTLVRENLRGGDVFVDVGAHHGYFTLMASQLVSPSGRVLAIEPSGAVAGQLRENVQASGLTNVLIEEVACDEEERDATLFIHQGSNSGETSLASANVTGARPMTVHCTTLDSLLGKHSIDRVRLVKIDVEGAELSVLRGAQGMLKNARPLIVLELEPPLLASFGVSMDEVERFLRQFDYRVVPMAGHANFLAQPESRSGTSN